MKHPGETWPGVSRKIINSAKTIKNCNYPAFNYSCSVEGIIERLTGNADHLWLFKHPAGTWPDRCFQKRE